jgi:aconitate hydratase
MGVLSLEYLPGETRESLGLTGEEEFTIHGLDAALTPKQTVQVSARSGQTEKKFSVRVRIDTAIEVEYYRHGGILPMVIRQLARA